MYADPCGYRWIWGSEARDERVSVLTCSYIAPYSYLDHFPSNRSTALGSALLAGSAINLFGWDVSRPSTLVHVNTLGGRTFEPSLPEEEREMRWTKWKRAVERSMGWDEAPDED